MVSLPGFGQTGLDAGFVGNGATIQGYAGLASLTGYEDGIPRSSVNVWPDLVAGTAGAIAVAMALLWREKTGKGQFIEVAQAESVMTVIGEFILDYAANGHIQTPIGNSDQVMAPHGCYRCQGDDKWVAIAVGNDSEWKDLCLVMSKPELIADERFQDGFRRLEHQDELDIIISEWTKGQIPIEVMKRLQQVHIASGPVYSGEEIYKDPHLRDRNFFVEHNHPEVGKRELPGVFAKLSETPGAIQGPDPLFGEHTDWVLNELLAHSDNY